MAFDENKIMWTTDEIMAGAALDRIYEDVSAHMQAGPSNIAKLLIVLSNRGGDLYRVIGHLFSGADGMRKVLDRLKDLLCMLERDNDWIAGR